MPTKTKYSCENYGILAQKHGKTRHLTKITVHEDNIFEQHNIIYRTSTN